MTPTDWIGLVSAIALFLAGQGVVGRRLLLRSEERAKARLQSAEQALRGRIETEIRRLQALLDRVGLVHRAQFEVEFRAMQSIWANVTVLRGCMSDLRPMFSIGPEPEPTKEQEFERLKPKYGRFTDALDKVKDAVFQNEPFITPTLYRELYDGLLRAAQSEANSIRIHAREIGTPGWFETGERNIGDFLASANRVSAIIRGRLQELVVVPAATTGGEHG